MSHTGAASVRWQRLFSARVARHAVRTTRMELVPYRITCHTAASHVRMQWAPRTACYHRVSPIWLQARSAAPGGPGPPNGSASLPVRTAYCFKMFPLSPQGHQTRALPLQSVLKAPLPTIRRPLRRINTIHTQACKLLPINAPPHCQACATVSISSAESRDITNWSP
jgi:hypothetical protein